MTFFCQLILVHPTCSSSLTLQRHLILLTTTSSYTASTLILVSVIPHLTGLPHISLAELSMLAWDPPGPEQPPSPVVSNTDLSLDLCCSSCTCCHWAMARQHQKFSVHPHFVFPYLSDTPLPSDPTHHKVVIRRQLCPSPLA